MNNSIALWLPPESDHDQWREFVASDWSRTDYESAIYAAAADAKSKGLVVQIVSMPVSEMANQLDLKGWENSPDNRAAITALKSTGEI